MGSASIFHKQISCTERPRRKWQRHRCRIAEFAWLLPLFFCSHKFIISFIAMPPCAFLINSSSISYSCLQRHIVRTNFAKVFCVVICTLCNMALLWGYHFYCTATIIVSIPLQAKINDFKHTHRTKIKLRPDHQAAALSASIFRLQQCCFPSLNLCAYSKSKYFCVL